MVAATVQVVNGDEPTSCVGSVSIRLKNECVWSFLGSLGDCFTADPTVAGSETDLQYNLYNAFLVDFSIVGCDRLSAGTVNDELMLISKLIGTVVPTEHEVHAVADDGNVVSLTR